MKYIRNKFDDQISRVTRDMILDYRFVTSYNKWRENLVQVYPWEKFKTTSYYKVRGKWFISEETWKEYIKENRPGINFNELVAHVYNDPWIHIHRLGWIKFIIGSIQAWRIRCAKERENKKKMNGYEIIFGTEEKRNE